MTCEETVRGCDKSRAGCLNIGRGNRVDASKGPSRVSTEGAWMKRRGERNLLGHTGGIVGDGATGRVCQVHGGQQVLDAEATVSLSIPCR